MNKKTLTYVGIGLVVAVGGYFAYKHFFPKDDKPKTEEEPSGDAGKIEEPVKNRKEAIKESASVLETSDTDKVSEVSNTGRRRGLFGERSIDTSVDPRLAEAVSIRDEADRIRKAKGVRDARWFAELQGQKLKVSVQAFMLYKQSNASTQEKLDGAKTMLAWAKNR